MSRACKLLADFDGIEQVLQGRFRGCLHPRIAKRAELVFLVLKEIRIDRTRSDSRSALKGLDLRNIRQTAGKVPQHVQSQCGRCAGEPMNLGSVAEFLFERGCGRRLEELAEARARVRKSPRGDFNLETIENLCRLIEEC